MVDDASKGASKESEAILKEAELRHERPWELPYSDKVALDDVYYLFRIVLGRNPNRSEWPGHSSSVGDSLSRVAPRYFNSQEFRRRGLLEKASMDGIVKGNNGRFIVFGDPSDRVLQGPCLTGGYERHIADAFDRLLKPGDSVVDIGANLGFFSMLAASIVGDAGRVYAIEPNDMNIKLLESARVANGFENIRVMQIGLSDRIETLFLYSSEGNGSTSTLLPDAIFQSRTVAGFPLDTVLSGRDKPISLIKIDVEGFEYKALSGGSRLLSTDRPKIIFEFTPGNIVGIGAIDFLRWISAFGYTLLNLKGGHPPGTVQTEEQVMDEFHTARTGHLDILATPLAAP